ncbi:MAG: DUF5005 domain-containing protein [Planctomycetota bacterium]|nr:MAG: DUF5005 domain-containing protein [Planctomycetota bacterium]
MRCHSAFRLLVFAGWISFWALLSSPLVPAQGFTAEAAPEWDALFDRESGWTGADGIFSIPLDQDERPGGLGRSHTLFVFSDTFVGDVTPAGRRRNATLVNNTLGFLSTFASPPDPVEFHLDMSSGSADAVFRPKTPSANPGDWYWLKDGLALDGKVHLFASRFQTHPTIGFERVGLALITLDRSLRPPLQAAQQQELPFWYPAQGNRGEITYGAGIFANTQEAGAPQPDGYIYVYGVEEVPLNKKLHAARVLPQDFLDFSRWTFYDGQNWVSDPHQSVALTGRLSNELSLSPGPNGKYLLVFQADGVGKDVGLRVADSPVGPFGTLQRIYRCPEPDLLTDVFVYNAKGHPHLSETGELLISYNVNTLNFWDHFYYADIYRPRFLRLRWQ